MLLASHGIHGCPCVLNIHLFHPLFFFFLFSFFDPYFVSVSFSPDLAMYETKNS